MERRDLYEDDLTEERYPSPEKRDEAAADEVLDPDVSGGVPGTRGRVGSLRASSISGSLTAVVVGTGSASLLPGGGEPVSWTGPVSVRGCSPIDSARSASVSPGTAGRSVLCSVI